MRARTQSSSRGSRAGFSMVEMMAVVLILGMMATLVAIDWRAMLPRSDLNSTVRTLMATISGARSDAISRNREFGIEYDIDANRWRVVTPYLASGTASRGVPTGFAASFEERQRLGWLECKPSVEIAALWLDGEEYTRNPEGRPLYVRFDPLGASSAHSVILKQPTFDNYFTVEVLALTGLVRMHDGFYQREFVDDNSFGR